MAEERKEQRIAPGLAGVPVAESSICYIDGEQGIIEYRGIPIEQLAENSTFEETAYLLLMGRLPTRAQLDKFKFDLSRHRRLKYKVVDLIKQLPEGGHPMYALVASVAAMGMFYPCSDIMDPEQRYWAGIRLIAKMPTVTAAFHRLRRGDEHIIPRDDLDHAANFLYMLTGEVPDELTARVMDVCLILHADHELNASTFSARVTGSTLADPYCVVASAIGTLAGPLHGGANEEVLSMLREIGTLDRVRAYIEKRVKSKQLIMGMGHRVYKVKDPRATILQKLAVKLFAKHGGTPLYDVGLEVEKVAKELLGAKGIYPNVDFYSGILYDKIGISEDLFTPIFGIARVAGWVSHWIEQLKVNRIYRPSQVYTGAHGVEYTPIHVRE